MSDGGYHKEGMAMGLHYMNLMSDFGTVALAAALLSLAACSTSPLNAGDLGETRSTSLGDVLVGSDGDTLYTYEKDTSGHSNCTGGCAIIWPPAEADAQAQPRGDYTIITRSSGTRQWAYKGKPLYTYKLDGGPGAISGAGMNGVWHVAKP
jgi:predicted lipoprotein with Yx(FWY)xxD motif